MKHRYHKIGSSVKGHCVECPCEPSFRKRNSHRSQLVKEWNSLKCMDTDKIRWLDNAHINICHAVGISP